MDNRRFLKACELRDTGNLREALAEFYRIAEDTEDPIDKGGVLLNAGAIHQALGQYDQAREQLSAARRLVPQSEDSHNESSRDERLLQLEVRLGFEDADILSFEGKIEEALVKFDLLLKKHGSEMQDPEFREIYEMIQSRRGFILADLGRCREALPILKEAESFEARKAEVRFYLGHCYLADHEYSMAKGKLVEALKIGLYRRLEYRAHHELGIVYYRLKEYAQAKLEFVKGAEKADAEYIQQAQIWKWLENTSRSLGLKDEADRYSKLAMHS